MQDFDAKFETFKTALQAKVVKDYAAFDPEGRAPFLEFERGKKYIRIIANSGAQRSAFGFVDQETGDVLKASSWKAPAKNFARGNIADENTGCGRVRWTGVQ